MKKLRNIIIRNMTDSQREDVLLAMRETGQSTASQAVLAVCKGYARMVNVFQSNQAEVERLRRENARLRKGLSSVMAIQQQLHDCLNPVEG